MGPRRRTRAAAAAKVAAAAVKHSLSKPPPATPSSSSAVSKVEKSSFKLMSVKTRSPLKKFLEKNKINFEKGKAFYQMTKKETIQDYKTVVVMRKSDGQFITGESVREVLKIPRKMASSKFMVNLDELPDFEIFIQSTSHNRHLMPNTNILYQTKDDDALSCAGAGTAAAAAVADGGKVAPTAATTSKGRGCKRRAPAAPKEDDPPPAKSASTSSPKAKSSATPCGPVEVVFSFDTTGSMYPCLGAVRTQVQETITRLMADIPGLRVAVIAHGDYCDRSNYITKHVDFTNDVNRLCKFVRTVGCTGGGDFEECYELVLREAHSQLSWSRDSQKSLVVIGDATPHEPSYVLNDQNLDWRKECDTLKNKGIRIYAVQALNVSCSTNFYRDMARKTDGFHLHLDQFSSIVNFLMAICYREQGDDQLQVYEEELRSNSRGLNRELHRMFDNLAGRTTAFTAGGGGGGGGGGDDDVDSSELEPVNPSRFQILSVGSTRCSIKGFVQRNSLIFKTGRGFYEFTKPETISHKKEVVLVHRDTGDMFTGAEVCRLIGAGADRKISPASLAQYRVFVQSTSYNRMLMPDTGFLYEVDPEH